MNKILKYAMLCTAGIMGAIGLIIVIKSARPEHRMGLAEKMGKGIDERLRESKDALDTATARVQSIFETIKNGKA